MEEETATIGSDQRVRDLAGRVARGWVAACASEPMMIELLLPGELRYDLGELTKAVGA